MAIAGCCFFRSARVPLWQRRIPRRSLTAHVYLLRGVLNIFSLGLDDIAARCGEGIPVTVANFASWSSLADEAAAGHQQRQDQDDHLRRHSSKRPPCPHRRRAGSAGAPVKLAIGLDSVFAPGSRDAWNATQPLHSQWRRREPVATTGHSRAKASRISTFRTFLASGTCPSKEPDHAAEGDKRDHTPARLRPVLYQLRGAEPRQAGAANAGGPGRQGPQRYASSVQTPSLKRRCRNSCRLPRR